EFDVGSDALVQAGGAGAVAADDSGDVGAVTIEVARARADEVLAVNDASGKVGVGRVDAAVDDGDADAGAVKSGLLGECRPDGSARDIEPPFQAAIRRNVADARNLRDDRHKVPRDRKSHRLGKALEFLLQLSPARAERTQQGQSRSTVELDDHFNGS